MISHGFFTSSQPLPAPCLPVLFSAFFATTVATLVLTLCSQPCRPPAGGAAICLSPPASSTDIKKLTTFTAANFQDHKFHNFLLANRRKPWLIKIVWCWASAVCGCPQRPEVAASGFIFYRFRQVAVSRHTAKRATKKRRK
jgi:hypothetical protein